MQRATRAVDSDRYEHWRAHGIGCAVTALLAAVPIGLGMIDDPGSMLPLGGAFIRFGAIVGALALVLSTLLVAVLRSGMRGVIVVHVVSLPLAVAIFWIVALMIR